MRLQQGDRIVGSSRRSGSEGTRAEPLVILSAVAAPAPMCWRVARPEAWHHHSMVVKLDSLGEVSSLCLPGVKTTNRSSSYPPVSNRLGSSTRQQCGFSQGCIELWPMAGKRRCIRQGQQPFVSAYLVTGRHILMPTWIG